MKLTTTLAVVFTALLFGALALAQSFPSRSRLSLTSSGGANSPAAGWTSNGTTTSTTQIVSLGTGALNSSVLSGNKAIGLQSGAQIEWTSATGGLYADGSGTLTWLDVDGIYAVGPLQTASTKSAATVTIGGGGTVTATVVAGMRCTCTYSTVGIIIPLCNVATSTLTITGTVGADMTYHCI